MWWRFRVGDYQADSSMRLSSASSAVGAGSSYRSCRAAQRQTRQRMRTAPMSTMTLFSMAIVYPTLQRV